jgi:hypothetical protein
MIAFHDLPLAPNHNHFTAAVSLISMQALAQQSRPALSGTAEPDHIRTALRAQSGSGFANAESRVCWLRYCNGPVSRCHVGLSKQTARLYRSPTAVLASQHTGQLGPFTHGRALCPVDSGSRV